MNEISMVNAASLLESRYLKEQPPSNTQTPLNEFEKTSSTVMIHNDIEN